MRGEDIKKALLHQAATAAIKKYSSELGFDFNAYQEKLGKNFQEYYEQKLALSESENNQSSSSAQEAYKKRQLDFLNYSKHIDLLKSYSFISISKNPQISGEWQAMIQHANF